MLRAVVQTFLHHHFDCYLSNLTCYITTVLHQSKFDKAPSESPVKAELGKVQRLPTKL